MIDLKCFEDWALKNSITVERCGGKNDVFKNNVLKRLNNLKKITCFLDFINFFSNIESEDQKVWFLCFKDSEDQNEFLWNEIEKISESYAADELERNRIREW